MQKKKITASYDEFWQECCGTKIKNYDYLLPKSLVRRTLEDVPQKKRKDWLMRQKHLDQIESDIQKFCRN